MTALVFMGTPSFAVPILEGLIDSSYEVVGVVTQPDRRAGRGRRMTAPPVKELALVHHLSVLQPKSLRKAEIVNKLKGLKPEAIVVAGYGQILPPEVLAIPPHGCLNVHPSLLPKYRGPAPIAGALLAGEEETGVTIMLMDERMDTGPILAQKRLMIAFEDTTESLSEKLARLGADLLLETLPLWLRGEITPWPQADSRATYTEPIAKGDGLIDWSLPAIEIWRRCRAYHPWPSTYTYWQGKLLKILRAKPITQWRGAEKPGQVMRLRGGAVVATGEGALLLEEVQLAGKRAMGAEDFMHGRMDFVGSRLGRN